MSGKDHKKRTTLSIDEITLLSAKSEFNNLSAKFEEFLRKELAYIGDEKALKDKMKELEARIQQKKNEIRSLENEIDRLESLKNKNDKKQSEKNEKALRILRRIKKQTTKEKFKENDKVDFWSEELDKTPEELYEMVERNS